MHSCWRLRGFSSFSTFLISTEHNSFDISRELIIVVQEFQSVLSWSDNSGYFRAAFTCITTQPSTVCF